MNILKMTNVQKSFGRNHVIKDISFEVNKGEVVSIIGPSGSGKSTLLRCATLLETMDGGTLSYMGKDVAHIKNGKMEYVKDLNQFRSYFGLVFQNFNLFPHWTVLKNIIDAPISVQKRNPDEVKEEAKKLLEKMSLSDKPKAKHGRIKAVRNR
ncbi:MAG: amino acid ABC transporter ATP-binding protein, partial [Ruminococcus sp.]|nr:amino acid ABC transporter ATP-binding protein [Candidatus Copronaster equi]